MSALGVLANPWRLRCLPLLTVVDEIRKTYGEFFAQEETILAAVLEELYINEGKKFIFLIDEWDCVMRERQGATGIGRPPASVSGFFEKSPEGSALRGHGLYDGHNKNKPHRYVIEKMVFDADARSS